MSQSRQLAAIMFTDIVGYTALMGRDEQQAFDILRKNREIQKPLISYYNGTWIKELGDGVLVSFHTVTDAVMCAAAIHEACHAVEGLQLRIGIHQGEVVFEDNDVFGDGVNIAARLQAIAPVGRTWASESIHKNIINKREIISRFIKEETLKNVSEPVRIYELTVIASPTYQPEKMPESNQADHPISSKEQNPSSSSGNVAANSIAVLPFVNMSNDPDQEYFSDGISEDIINDLAQVSGLKVIGRTSSFSFKGKNLDLKLIGEQLKVSYILEGSVRKSGNKLRITAQLIKVSDGYHLYSEKFDREMEDVFAIQDEISLAILNAIKIKLFGSEKDVVLKKYTENIDAYQLYLNGRFYYNKYSRDGFLKAIDYFKAAIAIDPNYAIAYSGMSFCYMNLGHWNWMPADKCLPQAIQAANKSLELDDEIAESHLAVGRVLLHYEWKTRKAEMEYKKAIALNPNSAEIHVQLGFCASLLGNDKAAIEHAGKADSLDPFSLLNLNFIYFIYLVVIDPEKILAIGRRLIDLEPNFPAGHSAVGLANLFLRRYEEAFPELEMAVTLNPDLQNLSDLGFVYRLLGQKAKVREIIEKMKKIEGADIAGNTLTGLVYGYIGEWDTAFHYFDSAIENRESRILWVKFNLRGTQMDMKDPRVLRLFEKMGQPYL